MKCEKYNKVHKWSVKVTFYHVYMPLLLRLSNDIEENPGPIDINEIVDTTYTILADFHQGNQSMFGSNAGKQCVAMSLYAVVYNEIKSVIIWDLALLNSFLVNGNILYTIISSILKDFLLLTEVPEILSIGNDTFSLVYSDSFFGALWMDQNNGPYVTLEHAFHEVFDAGNYKAVLLTVGASTVAVLMPFPHVFRVFDSHSRNMHGMLVAVGYSVLVSIEGIQNLVRFFHHNCNRLDQNNQNTLFELKGLKCLRNISLSSLDNKANGTTINDHEEPTQQQDCVTEKKNTLAKEREKRQQTKQESVADREKRLVKLRQKKEKRQQESAAKRENILAKQRDRRPLKTTRICYRERK